MMVNVVEVSLDGFSRWYLENKTVLLERAQKSELENNNLAAEFLEEWPLERLSTMTIDEYVIGKGSENKSFCYELENGKYKPLYLGIRGGFSGKFGIYWNKGKNSYCEKKNEIIPIDQIDERFETLKTDLISIITKGINGEFSDMTFDTLLSKNSFLNRPAIVTKLLCAYSSGNMFCGRNTNSDKDVWEKLVKIEKQGGVYKQNHDLTTILKQKHPELDRGLLAGVLGDYLYYVRNRKNIFDPSEINDNVDSDILNTYVNTFSDILLDAKNIIFRGAPGTGKTHLANEIAAYIVSGGRKTVVENLSEEEKERIGFVQFHRSYDYTDFVEGLRPTTSDDGIVSFALKPGSFMSFVEKAKVSKQTNGQDNFDDAKYVFIIDEINRGEISKIFGELFFSLDPGYRGPKGGVMTQYSNLHQHPTERFYIPENVYIIGTMNDIDRSVDTFDFAMRRRFTFIEITAAESAKNMLKNVDVITRMNRLNDAIIEVGGLTEDYQIGASYFKELDNKGLDEKSLKALWNHKLKPLLKDYFRGEHKSVEKLKELEGIFFDGVLDDETQVNS